MCKYALYKQTSIAVFHQTLQAIFLDVLLKPIDWIPRHILARLISFQEYGLISSHVTWNAVKSHDLP